MRTSKSYITTLDPMSAYDMEMLSNMRGMIKTINKNPAAPNTKYYVKLHGRGSRVEATWKSGNPSNYVRYCRELPLRFAERIDVYIYRRK